MAFAFSAEAQEFVPQTASLKMKLCGSLSVDAAVFIPSTANSTNNNVNSSNNHIYPNNNNSKVQREKSTPVVRKKTLDKSSSVQRRGRFAQHDSRPASSKKLPFNDNKKNSNNNNNNNNNSNSNNNSNNNNSNNNNSNNSSSSKICSNNSSNSTNVDNKSTSTENNLSLPQHLKIPSDEKPAEKTTEGKITLAKKIQKEILHRKLKQSFSLEHSKQQKNPMQQSTDELTGTISATGPGNISSKKSPLGYSGSCGTFSMDYGEFPAGLGITGCGSLSGSSGESKPIVLWSSVVKKEQQHDKVTQQETSTTAAVRKTQSQTPTDGSDSSKKYSKNKVTRTKNVLSEGGKGSGGDPIVDFNWNSDGEPVVSKEINASTNQASKQTVRQRPQNTTTNNNNNNHSSNNSNTNNSYNNRNSNNNSKNNDSSSSDNSCTNYNKAVTRPRKVVDASKTQNNSKPQTLEEILKQPFNAEEFSISLSKTGVDRWSERKVARTVKNSPNAGLDKTKPVANDRMTEKTVLLTSDIQNTTKRQNPKVEVDAFVPTSDGFPSLIGSVPPMLPTKLSYSDMAKRVPVAKPQVPPPQPSQPANAAKKETTSHSTDLTDEEIRIMKKLKKKEKRKNKVKMRKEEAKAQSASEAKPPKASDNSSKNTQDHTITLDLGDMFSTLLKASAEKKSQRSTKAKKSTGIISVVPGLAKKNTPTGRKVERNKYGTTSTIMDGTIDGIRKRGKERETPKKKRPTLLKKVINAERERRRRLAAEQTEALAAEGGESSAEGVQEEAEVVKCPPTTTSQDELVAELPVPEEVPILSGYPEEVCKQIHSKKFREYCDHILSKDINQLTYELLVTLQKFQDRVYHENPTKYKQKRRFILGLREVLKHLKLKRLKAVIIAPNIERITSKGGLNDYLGSILNLCNEQEIPKIFAMNRHVLGRIVKKLAPVSVVGIFDYDGAHEIFKDIISHVQSAKAAYTKKVNELCNETNNSSAAAAATLPSASASDISIGVVDVDADAEDVQAKEPPENKEQIRGVNQRVLDRLTLDDYNGPSGDSESDAWVTDNEGMPAT